MPETSAERRARIRKRLKEANTPQAEVTRNIVAEEPKEEEKEEVAATAEQPAASSNPPSRKRFSSRNTANRVMQQRNSKPSNYKIHVVTALSLAVAINVAALGWKAVVGKA